MSASNAAIAMMLTRPYFSVRPSPVPRPPLPPFPEPVNYRTTLPWNPPRTRDYLRANAWSVTIPGLPYVEGASSRHPERCLTWFLDRWSKDWQRRILDQHAKNDYTHFVLSAADSMAPVDCAIPNIRPGGAGQSLQQFVQMCGFVKSYGFYVKVFIGSKYYSPLTMEPNQSAQWWADYSQPIMEALIRARVVDELNLSWEWNLYNDPGSLSQDPQNRTTIKAWRQFGQYAHAAGISAWLHFSPHVTAWFADKDPRGRFGFYDDLMGDVDGIDYQGISTWDPKERQDRTVDTLWQFGEGGNRYKFRYYEDCATDQFDNDQPDETTGDQRGYINCCTIDDVKWTDAKVWGFGNGARRPDGTSL